MRAKPDMAAGFWSGLRFRLESELCAFARDIVDAISAAQKLCGFLDRAAEFDRGLEIVDVHLSPVCAVVDVHHWSRFSLRFPQ
jgi:hypothetical protein